MGVEFCRFGGEVKANFDFTELNQGIPFEGLKWSPDGKYLVFSDSIYLYLFNVMSREVKKLAGDSNSRCKSPSWSQDSREILYIKSISSDAGEIRLIDIITGKQRLIKSVKQKHVLISYPLFFENDQKIIFSNGINNFEIIDRAGSSVSVFDIPYKSPTVSLKSLLNSSQALEFMNSSKNRDNLIFYKGEAKMLKLDSMEVTEVEGVRAHSWAPDDNLWVYENSEEEIFLKPKSMRAIDILNGTSPA